MAAPQPSGHSAQDRPASQDGAAREPLAHRRMGRILLLALLGIALVGGVIAVIGHVAEYGRLREALDRMDAGWLVLGVAGEALAFGGYVLAYRAVAGMRGGPRLGLVTTAHVVALGFGAFVAGSSAGGLAVDLWALRRAGCTVHDAARRVLGLNTLQWAWLALAAGACGIVALAGLAPGVPALMALAWIGVVVVCFGAGTWVSAPRRVERLSRVHRVPEPARLAPRSLALWVGRWLRVALADAIGGLVFVREVLRHPLRHRVGAVGYPLYWAGQLIALEVALRAFDAHVGVAALVLAYATGYAASALPLPVGGAGGIDASLTLTLTLVGVPLTPALLGAVAYRGMTFWLPVAPALLLLAGAPRLARDLDDTAIRGSAA
jgi:P-type Mg2+ transporter